MRPSMDRRVPPHHLCPLMAPVHFTPVPPAPQPVRRECAPRLFVVRGVSPQPRTRAAAARGDTAVATETEATEDSEREKMAARRPLGAR